MEYQASCVALQTGKRIVPRPKIDKRFDDMKRTEDMVLPQPPSSSARSLGTKLSKNQRDASPPPLPEEIPVEIFARLPAKTVGRCRCLSRSWAAELSSASFVDLHHQQANHNQQHAGLPPNLFITTAQRCLHAWRWGHDDGLPVLHPLTGGAALSLLPQLDRDRALRVLTAKPCHGLVLLHRWPWHGHYVCNPSTGALSALPDTKMPSRMSCRYSPPNTDVNCVSYGLGYDAAAKQHKVVRLFYLDEGGSAAPVTACEVFSIGGRRTCAHWRPAAQRAPLCTVRPSTPAVFFCGRLYFLQQEHGSCIITFNVHAETFGSLMPPSASGLDNVTFELTVLDGCLCLHHGNGPSTTGDVEDDTDFYVWRLRPPYHGAGAGQWEPFCCIQRQSWPEALLNLDRISPLEIYRSGNGHNKIMFSTCALTVFAVDVDLYGGGVPEILLSPPTGDDVVDSFIEINSRSHAMHNFVQSNCGSHSTVGLLEESLAPVGRASEEIVFSSPSTKAWSDVLKWLPTRSVVPLRRVCKDWRAVINSDRFMQLHTIHANMAKKRPRIKLIDPCSGLIRTLGEGCGRELHPRNMVGFLFCPSLGSGMVCCKPCHGLVVGSCTTQKTSFDFVCNPTMGYYKQMLLDPDGDHTFLAGRIGLGYDSRMNKHVRVRLVYRERNTDTRNYQLRCYVHLTDTEAAWRPISSPPRPVAEMQPVFVDSKLYWMVDPNLGAKSSFPPSGCEMLALDVSTEEFEVLQGPRCSYDQITSIVELNGNLCVVCSDRGTNALGIWTLEGGVWDIGCRVELGEFSHQYSPEGTTPMAIDPTDGRLLLSTGRALGYYSPMTKTVETIHRLVGQDVMRFAPVLTEESLICPYIRFEKATYSVGVGL